MEGGISDKSKPEGGIGREEETPLTKRAWTAVAS